MKLIDICLRDLSPEKQKEIMEVGGSTVEDMCWDVLLFQVMIGDLEELEKLKEDSQ